MAITLTAFPNPAEPGSRVRVEGTGFGSTRIRIFLDGVIQATVKATKDGTFHLGVVVSSTPKTQQLVAKKYSKKSWHEVAQITITVKDSPPPPLPSDPQLEFTTSIVNSQTIGGVIQWTATVTQGIPLSFDFLVDGAVYWTELLAPWGGLLDTTEFTNGLHELKVIGYDSYGSHSSTFTVTIYNAVVEPPPPVEVPFLSRPKSTSRVINGGTDVEITGFTFQGSGGVNNPQGIGITLLNVTRAWIHHNDFADLIGGIYISKCTDVVIEDNRGRNIGDGSIGSGHSNYIQFGETRGGAIRRNRFLGGRTEDMISTWHSGGWGIGKELIIEYNHLEGLVSDTSTARAWVGGSGTGTILSDGGGHAYNGYIILRENTFLTPGQVGIQIIDGPGLQVYNNIILAEKRVSNNNPMTTWEGVPKGEAHHNRYYWTNLDGSHPSPWKHGGGGGMNFHDNIEDPALKASDLRVVL